MCKRQHARGNEIDERDAVQNERVVKRTIRDSPEAVVQVGIGELCRRGATRLKEMNPNDPSSTT